ncbi:MAG: DUF167 domain-containing protein [Burkholderiaceae bacterium]|nr:DUF167 domain-containing protein [Burkholderiaceae bacterium]
MAARDRPGQARRAASRGARGVDADADADAGSAAKRVTASATAQFIQVKVKPNAAISVLQQDESGAWSAQLKSAPVDGKANSELVNLIARQFACSRSAVTIRSGGGARLKLVRIELKRA